VVVVVRAVGGINEGITSWLYSTNGRPESKRDLSSKIGLSEVKKKRTQVRDGIPYVQMGD